MFPTAELIAPELKEKYGKFFRDNNPMKTEKCKEHFKNLFTGRKLLDSTKEKLSQIKLGKPTRPHSAETKAKISDSNKKTYREKIASGYVPPKNTLTEQGRKILSDRMLGNQLGKLGNHNKGKLLNLTSAQRANRSKKRVTYLAENKGVKANTSIELQFKHFLETNQISYIHQHPVHTNNGSWLFDFYLPDRNLYVEIDGEFWHSTKQAIRRDKIKNKLVNSIGACLARISSDSLEFAVIFSDEQHIWGKNYALIQSRESKHA